MIIQHNVAFSNENIIYAIPLSRGSPSFIDHKSFITTQMFNSIRQKSDTNLVIDNVLILGHNSNHNQNIAQLVKSAFSNIGQKTQIIDADKFLNLPMKERIIMGFKYIITYSDQILQKQKLSTLVGCSGTKILFKLNGLNKRISKRGVASSPGAKQNLQILNIKTENIIGIRLLAFLEDKEFCVLNYKNISKRMLH